MNSTLKLTLESDRTDEKDNFPCILKSKTTPNVYLATKHWERTRQGESRGTIILINIGVDDPEGIYHVGPLGGVHVYYNEMEVFNAFYILPPSYKLTISN
jgi:hypothetical protein